MNEKMDNVADKATYNGIRVVLNGGSSLMESATIPIQWFFDPELIPKRPTHVLIIEQNMHEIGTANRGVRHLYNVTDRVAFIQLFSPGLHRIAILALDDTPDDGNDFVLRQDRMYKTHIRLSDIMSGIETGNYWGMDRKDVIGATVVDIEVPKELFASKKETWFSIAVWKWVNRWHTTPPRDECQYRARFMLAFTIQPPLFLIGRTFMLTVRAVMSIIYPMVRVAVFLFGFRPTPIFSDLDIIWREWDNNTSSPDIISPKGGKRYRVWLTDYEGRAVKKMPTTGLELGLICAAIYIVYWLAKWWSWHPVVFILSSAVAAILMVSIIIWRMSRKSAGEAEIQADRAHDDDARYERWLNHLSSSHVPKKVDLSKLPPAYKGSVVQRFRVGYWNLKMKVCRPYSR